VGKIDVNELVIVTAACQLFWQDALIIHYSTLVLIFFKVSTFLTSITTSTSQLHILLSSLCFCGTLHAALEAENHASVDAV